MLNKGNHWPALLLLGSLWWYTLPGGLTAVVPASAAAQPGRQLVADEPALAPSTTDVMATAVNHLRRRHNLPPYQSNATLVALAQSQANRMAALQSVTHVGVNNSDAAKRAAAAGYPDRATEIIYGGPGSHDRAIAWWLNSSLHQSLLLSDRYFEFGVGRAVGANDHTYWAIVIGAAVLTTVVEPEASEPQVSSAGTPPLASGHPVPAAAEEATNSVQQRPPQTRSRAPLRSILEVPEKTFRRAIPHNPAVSIRHLPPPQSDAATLTRPVEPATAAAPPSDMVVAGLGGGVVASLLLAAAVYRKRSSLRRPRRNSARSGLLRRP